MAASGFIVKRCEVRAAQSWGSLGLRAWPCCPQCCLLPATEVLVCLLTLAREGSSARPGLSCSGLARACVRARLSEVVPTACQGWPPCAGGRAVGSPTAGQKGPSVATPLPSCGHSGGPLRLVQTVSHVTQVLAVPAHPSVSVEPSHQVSCGERAGWAGAALLWARAQSALCAERPPCTGLWPLQATVASASTSRSRSWPAGCPARSLASSRAAAP